MAFASRETAHRGHRGAIATVTSRCDRRRAAATAHAPSEAAPRPTMAAAVETELTEAQRYIKEHGPAPRAVCQPHPDSWDSSTCSSSSVTLMGSCSNSSSARPPPPPPSLLPSLPPVQPLSSTCPPPTRFAGGSARTVACEADFFFSGRRRVVVAGEVRGVFVYTPKCRNPPKFRNAQ